MRFRRADFAGDKLVTYTSGQREISRATDRLRKPYCTRNSVREQKRTPGHNLVRKL
jgi:hypothetical protein